MQTPGNPLISSFNATAVKSCPFYPGMTESETNFIASFPQKDAGGGEITGGDSHSMCTVPELSPNPTIGSTTVPDTMGGAGLLSESGSDLKAAAHLVIGFLRESWNMKNRLLETQ